MYISIGLVEFVSPRMGDFSIMAKHISGETYIVKNSLMLMRRRWNELTILSPQECLDYNLITITIDEERMSMI